MPTSTAVNTHQPYLICCSCGAQFLHRHQCMNVLTGTALNRYVPAATYSTVTQGTYFLHEKTREEIR